MTDKKSATLTSAIKPISFLGFTVHPGTINNYLTLIDLAVQQKTQLTVLYHNLHSLYTYFTSSRLRECYDKCTVLVDGMPIIGLLRLGGYEVNREQRVTYVDFIWPILEHAEKNNLRVFHIGQSKSIQQKALSNIRSRLPDLNIEGHEGYFDLSDNSDDTLRVINEVNEFAADILLVGFGAPKQEFWVDTHRHLIKAPALFTCGACMEYVAGAVKTPPRWMGRTGLEWSYRLFENPRRFAFRYLIEPVLLGLILFRNLLLPKQSTSPKSRQSGRPNN